MKFNIYCVKTLTLVFLLLSTMVSLAQNSVSLVFAGIDQHNNYVRLDSIVIENQTREWSETIFFPDTIFTMNYGVGIDHRSQENVMQVMPNPFDGNTRVNIIASKASAVRMLLLDVNGKKFAEYNGELVAGNNLFEISLTIPQVYILQFVTDEGISSLKMVNKGHAGMDRIESVVKMEKKVNVDLKSTSVHEFELGDEMHYTGYTHIQGVQLQSDVITQAQFESEALSLRFSIIPPLTVMADSITVSGNNVHCYGTVVSGENVTERGFCWHTSTFPTIENTHFACGVGLGSFTCQITGIVPGTTYYVRAYAINGIDTSYSNQIDLTISANPTVNIVSVYDVSFFEATVGYEVLATGVPDIITRGICWSSSPNPTIADSHIVDSVPVNTSGFGLFANNMTGLNLNTQYYVRAYAINSSGIGYSSQSVITTLNTPTITTFPITNLQDSTATCGGNITSDGGGALINKGICWSMSPNPTINDFLAFSTSAQNTFTCEMTGLIMDSIYYVRAFATNGGGTVYGNEVSFISGGDGRPCPGAATVTDIDGNIYNTVLIGNQCWMKENLRTTRYTDSTVIEAGTSTSSYPRRYAPNNDENNVATYGYLYNWWAVRNGICPEGWHVPSDAEWTTLTDYVSSQSQYVCGSDSSFIAKSLAATTGWNNSAGTCHIGNTQSLNNATGFSALPAGGYTTQCFNFGKNACFWRASSYNGHAYYRSLYYAYAGVTIATVNDLYYSVSLRCIRN